MLVFLMVMVMVLLLVHFLLVRALTPVGVI
jgi:hypothetical protein